MAINWTEYSKLLATYREALQNIVPYLSPVWNRLQQASPAEFKVVGKQIQVPLILSRGHGFKAGGIPSINNPALDSAYHDIYEFFIAEEFETRVFDMDLNEGQRTIATRLDGRISEMQDHFERMLFGDGNGKIAIISDATNAPTYKVAPAFVRDIPEYANDATKYARVGMKVDVINHSTGAVRGTATIVSVNQANSTITLSASISGASADDPIVVSGSYGGKEFIGFPGIIGSGAYGGINPSTYPLWKSYVVSGSAGNDVELTTRFIFEFISALKSYMGSGFNVNLAITTPKVLGVLMEVMRDYVRVPVIAGATIQVGFRGAVLVHPDLPTGTCEVIASDYCNEGTIYFVDTNCLKYAWVKGFDWETIGGSYFLPKMIAGEAVYQVIGRTTFAFYALNRRAVGAITDIKIA